MCSIMVRKRIRTLACIPSGAELRLAQKRSKDKQLHGSGRDLGTCSPRAPKLQKHKFTFSIFWRPESLNLKMIRKTPQLKQLRFVFGAIRFFRFSGDMEKSLEP